SADSADSAGSANSADSELSAVQKWKDTTQGYMSTPVVLDGHAYLHLRNQRLTCFDIASGAQRWTTRERFGKYMSLIRQKDLILALDERGILYLWRATPEKFDLIDQRKVSDSPTWAHVAVSGGEIFIRELKAISAFRWSAPGAPPSAPAHSL
ncbi:MAG: hypothetical protein JXA90_07605, partial [Planctomycetes bacterium]|nr:hypothetical protein [Planctomycetota bacterium]